MKEPQEIFGDIVKLLDCETLLAPAIIFTDLIGEILKLKNDQGETMLHIACRAGRTDAVEFLLENYKEDLDLEATVCNEDKGLSGVTPLHYACFYGFAEIVELLLDNDANPLAYDDNEESPLAFAIQNNEYKVIDVYAKWVEDTKNFFGLIDTAMKKETAGTLQQKFESGMEKIKMGKYKLAKGDFEGIIEICDKVLHQSEETEDDVWTLYQKKRACIFMGKINYVLKHYQEAANFYTRAISCEETLLDTIDDGEELFSIYTLFDGADVYFYRSEAYLALSKLAEAKQDYKKALEQYEQNMSVKANRIISTVLSHAAKFGYADIVKVMLKYGVVPDENILAYVDTFNAPLIHDFKSRGAKGLLKYRPSKRNSQLPTLLNLATEPTPDMKKINNQIFDYENTSDEDSSDSEKESFKIVNRDLTQKIVNNNNCHQFVRGVHYTPNYFDTTKKRKRSTLEVDEHKKPVLSLGTMELANKLKRTKDNNIDYEHADKLVKSYFEMLKVTPNKPELNKEYKKVERKINSERATFDSHYYNFIQVYVNKNGYNTLFNEGSMARNFNFPFNKTPVVSITPAFNVGYAYSSGERNNNPAHRFFGKCRLSTGTLKHRRLGCVEVYLIENSYYETHGANIDQIKAEGRISISHNYSYNKESFIESSIPEQYILGYQAFGLPSFNNEWSSDIYDQYGLAEDEYNKVRSVLSEHANNSDIAQINKTLEGVITKVSKHQAELLEGQVKMLLVDNANNIIPSMTS